MSAALTEGFPPVDGWTTDDLDELPEDGRRRELIDGVLIMTPSPSYAHQTLAGRLMAALEASCPDEYVVTQAVEIRVNRRRSLVPDVLAVTSEAAQRLPSMFAPHEVVLTVEIVSPGSRTLDRFAKPALYAEAGIPFFWRVETEDGIVVCTHRLDPSRERYEETGQFTTTLDVTEPWPINLSIESIKPRHLS